MPAFLGFFALLGLKQRPGHPNLRKKMKLHSSEARMNADNIASGKLLEKAGFIREAYFKEDYCYNGRFIDTAVYSLLTK